MVSPGSQEDHQDSKTQEVGSGGSQELPIVEEYSQSLMYPRDGCGAQHDLWEAGCGKVLEGGLGC